MGFLEVNIEIEFDMKNVCCGLKFMKERGRNQNWVEEDVEIRCRFKIILVNLVESFGINIIYQSYFILC